MSTIAVGERCPECNEVLASSGNCLNVNCDLATEQATSGAARKTAKATAESVGAPSAWTSKGGVD